MKNRIGRLVQSNWFVAAVCTIVSLSTVSWIAYMGQRIPTEASPPYGSVQGIDTSEHAEPDFVTVYDQNPYGGMTCDDLYELYMLQEAAITQTVTDHMNLQYQTPYYVFLSDLENGVCVFNKLTGAYESICKIEGCDHTDSFYCPAAYTGGLVPGSLRVEKDCIYAVLENERGEQALLTFGLALTEPKILGSYSSSAAYDVTYRNLLVDNENLYDICINISRQNNEFLFHPKYYSVEHEKIQSFPSMISYKQDGKYLYFTTHEGVWQADLHTREIIMLLSATELGYEIYDLQAQSSSSGYPLLTALKNGCLYIETVMVTGERCYLTLTLDTMTLDMYIPAWQEGDPESVLVYDGNVYMVEQGIIYRAQIDGNGTELVTRIDHKGSCTLVSCDGKILYAETEADILMIELETGRIYIP